MLNIFGCTTSIETQPECILDSTAIIKRIAKTYKDLPSQYDDAEEDVRDQVYNGVTYYDVGTIFYIPAGEVVGSPLEKDAYFKTEEQLKTYIDNNGKH